MPEIYARIDGVNLYRVSATEEQMGALRQSERDFLPIGPNPIASTSTLVAVSWETLVALELS